MTAVLTGSVYVTLPGRAEATFLPAGTKLSREHAALITNPKLLAVVEDADEHENGDEHPEVPDYERMLKKDIQELADRRGVASDGTIKVIAARLHEQDEKAKAEADTAAADAETTDEGDADIDTLDEPALRKLAGEKGIDVSEAQTAEELRAAIESATE